MGGAPEPTIRYLGGTGVMTNDETMAKAAVTVLTPAFGKRLAFAPASATPMSGSEDFSEYVDAGVRSEEHTSELQSLMRISYAVFCLKKKKHTHITPIRQTKIRYNKTCV